MSQEHFEHFRQLVLQDLSLQETLRGFAERPLLIQKIIDLGSERGYEITPDDVMEALRGSRREWIDRWI